MKRIQVREKAANISSGGFLNVLHDREKKNTLTIANTFPHLWKIVLGGCLAAVICLALLYIADPNLAGEWSSHAIDSLPFNVSALRSGAKSTVLHYASFVQQWASGNDSFTSQNPIEPPLPPLRAGYYAGLITHEQGFEFVWQPPVRRSKNPHGGGFLFIAPACKRPATDWFPKSENCTACRGMPIQVSLVNTFRRAGYAVLVMDPFENRYKSQCWHQNDRQQVGLAIQYVRQATADIFGGATVGLYALGVENGGVFLGNFAESLGITYQSKISALCLMNSGIWHMNMKAATFPAVVFLDLARNGELCEHNNVTIQRLTEKSIEATQFYSEPRPIDKHYFVSLMSAAQSEAYQQALIQAGYVWPASHVLLKDPTTERYRYDMVEILSKIAPAVAAGESSTQPNSALMQLLRLAWGYKEVNDDHLDKVIAWFEQHGPGVKQAIGEAPVAPIVIR